MRINKIIYDNIIYSLQNVGGISNYWTEIIKRVRKKKNVVFYEKKNNNIFSIGTKIKVFNESFIPAKWLRFLPFQKKIPPKSLFHSSYYRTTYQKNVVKIVTVYDFINEYYEKNLSSRLFEWQKNLAIKNADGIICISNSTRKDLFKFFPEIKKKKVRTIYISTKKSFFQIKNLAENIKDKDLNFLIRKKIILYVGSRKKAYKNFFMAVDIVSSLKDYILVSVGPDEISQNEKKKIEPKLKGKFYHFTKISSHKLNKLYNISFCLLYPSIYEGFGIPVLEAMKAGCPVVSTNKSSIPEVAGKAAILVNKIKKKNFISGIKLLNNKNFRAKQIKKGIYQSKKFSWKKCYKDTIKFYSEVSVN